MNRELERTRSLYHAARVISLVAGVFSLTVCALLTVNVIRLRISDPLNAPALLTLIEQQDNAIEQTRRFWENAPDRDKASWMKKIDTMLDHRLELMQVREGKMNLNPS